MTTRAEIEALIKRLEEAKEGDSALDRAIRDCLSLPAMLVPPDGGDEAHPYTTSVDAALTLVAGGWRYDLYGGPDAFRDSGASAILAVSPDDGKTNPVNGDAATDALALCIAALRARLSDMKDDANDA